MGCFKQTTEEMGGADGIRWPSFDFGIEGLP